MGSSQPQVAIPRDYQFYSLLLKEDDNVFYRNVSDPTSWPLPHVPAALGGEGTALASFASRPTVKEILERRDRRATQQARRYAQEYNQWKAQQHRALAHDLRYWAEKEQDAHKRRRFESAAHLNDTFAQTLEVLALDPMDDVPTAEENRAMCEYEVSQLQREHEKLTEQVRRSWFPQRRRALGTQLVDIGRHLDRRRKELPALQTAEREAAERSHQEWQALEEAKRLVAEGDGRAQFNELEPDIRRRLCAQWRACEQVKRYEDETALTMAIGDVLMTVGSAVPVATLAVLVMKIGVKKFCNCPA